MDAHEGRCSVIKQRTFSAKERRPKALNQRACIGASEQMQFDYVKCGARERARRVCVRECASSVCSEVRKRRMIFLSLLAAIRRGQTLTVRDLLGTERSSNACAYADNFRSSSSNTSGPFSPTYFSVIRSLSRAAFFFFFTPEHTAGKQNERRQQRLTKTQPSEHNASRISTTKRSTIRGHRSTLHQFLFDGKERLAFCVSFRETHQRRNNFIFWAKAAVNNSEGGSVVDVFLLLLVSSFLLF